MKKFLVVVVIILVGVYMFGCGKKEAGLEGTTESVSMESLSTVEPTPVAGEAASSAPAAPASVAAPMVAAKLEPLPPAGPYKPSIKEIQAALKNANFYTGKVDGKMGPMTKKAIEEFQKANSLKVDGKVGPKTWEALSKNLTAATTAGSAQ